MSNKHSWEQEEDEDVAVLDDDGRKNAIVLYNDDFNTFEHVIECLMKYCKHEPAQAEQCALIVHHNGKCSVKEGEMDKLKPICQALLDNKLSATIE